MNLSQVSLKLLRVFSAIYLDHSTTKAAERLGLTQSAVSHSLRQLRQIFEDELFLNTSNGMVPTELAAEIGERLPKALTDLEATLLPTGFVPTNAERTFRVSCSDYTSYTFMPKVFERFQREAPLCHLSVVPMGRRIIQQLERGNIDILIAGVRGVPRQLEYEHLFFEKSVWVVRNGHPVLRKPRAMGGLQDLRSVAVDYGFGDDEYPHDIFASRNGMVQWTRTIADEIEMVEQSSSRVETVVPNFFAAVALVTQSDLATLLPLRLARDLAPKFDLVFLPERHSQMGGDLSQIWHHNFGAQPAVRWLRDLIKSCAEQET